MHWFCSPISKKSTRTFLLVLQSFMIQQRALFAWYSIAKAIFRNQNNNTGQLRYFDNNLSRTLKKAEIYFKNCIQLFRERLSGKVHATILKGIVGGFEFSFFQRNLKELARKALEMCLRVLKESNKSTVAVCLSYRQLQSPGTVYWSYPILPFGIVACTFFPTTFLEVAVLIK